MRVFISWSGETSKQLGEALRSWLPSTLQFVKPYFTPTDIEKGAKWDKEISNELEASDFCIVALTRESLESQWIMFEAGAIARAQKKGRVCAILFGIEPTDVEGPLQTFQAAKFSKEEIRQLLTTINTNAGDRALSPLVLNNVFDMWWPDLDGKVGTILEKARSLPSKEVRDERSLLEETLGVVRKISSEQESLRLLTIRTLQLVTSNLNPALANLITSSRGVSGSSSGLGLGVGVAGTTGIVGPSEGIAGTTGMVGPSEGIARPTRTTAPSEGINPGGIVGRSGHPGGTTGSG
jgi:hypothetical protein